MKVKTSPEMKTAGKTGSKGVQPRSRIKYTAAQLQHLETAFMTTQYPDSSILEELSQTLSINTDRISIWFQNRRSKFKRQSKGNHVNWMRQQIFQKDTAQSRDTTVQSAKGHVLSPPTSSPTQRQDANRKPISNLHYLPSYPPSYPPFYDYDYYSLPATTVTTNPATSSLTTTSQPTSSYASTDSFSCGPLFSQSETTSPTPSYSQPASGYFSQHATASSVSDFYNYGLQCYNLPAPQLNFSQIGV